MVFTNKANIDAYVSLHPRFKAAFDALRKYANESTPDGHYVVDGDNLFVNVDTYVPGKRDKEWYEQHHRYIDIQCIVTGKETIKAIDLSCGELVDSYVPERECAFYVPKAGVGVFNMEAGDALILFPEDPHCPGNETVAGTTVKKVIVKVKVAD